MKHFIFMFIMFFAVSALAVNDNSGIIIGSKVRVRSKPNTSGTIITTLDSGYLVEILDKSEKLFQLDKKNEFKYRWYQISGSFGKGWVYGQFLYKNNKLKGLNRPFNINGNDYKVVVFSESGEHDDVPEGSSYSVPCFYNTKSKTIHLISMKGFKYSDNICHEINPKYEFLRFISNSGCGQVIESMPLLKKNNNIIEIYLIVTTYFQEGMSSHELILIENKGKFNIKGSTKSKKIGF